jgi:hypothetical protein
MESKHKSHLETQDETAGTGTAPVAENLENSETQSVVAETESAVEPIELAIETAPEELSDDPKDAVQTEEETQTQVPVEREEPEEVAAQENEKEESVELPALNVEEVVESVEVAGADARSEEDIVDYISDIENIEEEIDETGEDVSEQKYDYSSLSDLELVNTLKELLAAHSYSELAGKVESIKANFYKNHKAKQLVQKENFIKEGGSEDDFVMEENPYEAELKELLKEYQQKKADFARDQEAEKEVNLQKKYEIIEEIKNLINRKESINKTFQEFKDLQQKWREIGLVPQASMKDLWDTYHHHVENFYDYIKINKELRDLDLKRNMEEKISICEKTEALLLEPSVVKAFNSLQKFHEQWREVGPVPRDKKDELWERFKAATTQINKKHQDYFENRKKAQKKNYEAKIALCEKAEEFLSLELSTHKAWEDKSKELVELQKYWRTIGFAPKKENNEVYEWFRTACDAFFDKKRDFYSVHKEVQTNNLQLKLDLCIQAEALKESTDWKKTTDEFINIQKKWKEIGPVPRKQSDAIWKRFRSACDYFFQRKSSFFNNIDSEQGENLKLKNELVQEVIDFKPTGNDAEDFEKLRDFQRRWTDIGHVPINEKNNIQKRFRDAINIQFDQLRTEDKERNLLKYKNKMTELQHAPKGNNKLYLERDKHLSKLRQLESDLITLKNNIGFFAQSKNAEALIKDVKRKIAQNEEQIEYLKEKIRVIDDVDNEDQ